MTWQFIIWNDEPGENVDSSQRPLIYGTTPGGDYIVVIYEEIDDETIYPITAYIPDKD